MKRSAWLRRLSLLLIACGLSFVLLEGLCTAWAWMKYGETDIRKIEQSKTGSRTSTAEKFSEERSIDNFYPHPHLSYVRNPHGDQRDVPTFFRVNNVGTSGRDYPLKKDPSKFTILLIGGSVADDLSVAGEGDSPYLESFLNDRYTFDRPVRVLNGGNTGWTALHAEVFYSMYGEVGDAVVTVTGFNEWRASENQMRAEYPHLNFTRINPAATSGFEQLGAAWQSQRLREFSFRFPLKSLYFATSAVRQQLEASVEESTDATRLREMFSLPSEWSREQRAEFNLTQHRKYLSLIDTMAVSNGVPRAHVIQNVPAVGKTLTADELKVVVRHDYAEQYNAQAEKLLASGLPMIDLRQVFSDHPETIYCDSVHCRPSERRPTDQFRPSSGYRLMAERIADGLARSWGLQTKIASGR